MSSTEQIAVYKHIPKIHDSRRLFLTISDDAQSRNGLRERRAKYASRVLRSWVDSRFAKPWEEINALLAGWSESGPEN